MVANIFKLFFEKRPLRSPETMQDRAENGVLFPEHAVCPEGTPDFGLNQYIT